MTGSLPRIVVIRHGETEWARLGRHTGRTDVPLTPAGEALAQKLHDRVKALAPTEIISSPLSRAWRTAELAGFTPRLDPDILEWNYGDYEGKTSSEIRALRPGWLLFRDGAPNGESPADVAARADRVVARLKEATGTIVVFSHGHFLRVLASRWIEQPVDFARYLLLGTGAVCELGFDHQSRAEPAIVSWNG